MKNTMKIFAHLSFWILFTMLTYALSAMYLQAVPEAPFGQHLAWVISLEVLMGLIFFYTTYFGIPFAMKSKLNQVILVAILFILLVVFAYPATRFGILQLLSSVLPHLLLIFTGFLFYRTFASR